MSMYFFFFNDTATTEIYTLSLHDALPILMVKLDEATSMPPEQVVLISTGSQGEPLSALGRMARGDHHQITIEAGDTARDRKSTRLNSSHANISYAVFCLKKKNIPTI